GHLHGVLPHASLPLPRLWIARLEPTCRAAQPEIAAACHAPAGGRRRRRHSLLGDSAEAFRARGAALECARRAHLRHEHHRLRSADAIATSDLIMTRTYPPEFCPYRGL